MSTFRACIIRRAIGPKRMRMLQAKGVSLEELVLPSQRDVKRSFQLRVFAYLIVAVIISRIAAYCGQEAIGLNDSTSRVAGLGAMLLSLLIMYYVDATASFRSRCDAILARSGGELGGTG